MRKLGFFAFTALVLAGLQDGVPPPTMRALPLQRLASGLTHCK